MVFHEVTGVSSPVALWDSSGNLCSYSGSSVRFTFLRVILYVGY